MPPYDTDPKASYREVRLSGDEGEGSSYNEKETLTLRHPTEDDEDGYTDHAQELYALNRSLQRTNRYLMIIIGLFSSIFAFWLIVHVSMSYKAYTLIAGGSAPLIKTPVPNIPDKKVMFKEEKIYSRKPDDESDAAWDALLPNGRGFVYIPEWQKYDLPEGQETPWGMIYSVALYHQIHCLAELRKFSWMFLNSIIETNPQSQVTQQDKIRNMYHHGVHLEHMNHCFDYLRQTIFCGGDMTMEWPRTEADGETRIAVDGWDIEHTCKDMRVIEDYMKENHFNMSMEDRIAPAIPGKMKRWGSEVSSWN